MCKVIAIAMPQLNWSQVGKMTEIKDGESVLRTLDAKGIDSKDPKATQYGLPWSHLYYSFAVEIDTDEVSSILGHIHFDWTQLAKNKSVLILTTHLSDWQMLLLNWMSESTPYIQRAIATQIYNCFRGANIMQPWNQYTTKQLTDGTTVLCR